MKMIHEQSNKLRVVPLTPDVWPAFEDLFADGGPCSRCWCMYWRIGSDYRKKSPQTNRSAFHVLVKEGPPPGLVALLDKQAVGWCQFTPRTALPWLNQSGRLKPVDGSAVWSISCFYVRKNFRKTGVTAKLIDAAIDAARKHKAPALEAYPLNASLTRSTSFTGYTSTFLQAGFKPVAQPSASQQIMRLEL